MQKLVNKIKLELKLMSEVHVRKGDQIGKSLRILKRKVEAENTLKEVRRRRYYEKPSEIKRREGKRTAKRVSRLN